MRVKIGDEIYDSADVAIMVILDETNKSHIKNMAPTATKYAVFPLDHNLTDEDTLEWMNEL